MQGFSQELRHACRILASRPGYWLIATMTLALGIGAITSLFSVVHGVLVRPLPFADQDRLVVAWKRAASNPFVELSVAEFSDWQAQSRSFAALAAMPTTVAGYGHVLSGRGEALQLESSKVTGNFFSLLGARPALGRVFDESDEANGAPVIVLSHRTWRSVFGADAQIIGRSVTLENRSFTVIGVMPPEFAFPEGADFWTPLHATMNPRLLQNRGSTFVQAIGRLRPGVSRVQAETELSTIVARLAQQHPGTRASGQRAVVTPLADYIFGDNSKGFKLLLAATAFLLLIACANLANLALVRASARRKELALRAALGSSRWQMARLLVAESTVVTVGGALLGLALAFVLTKSLVHFAPSDIPRMQEVSLNPTVVTFSLLMTALTALGFAVMPALSATRPNLNETLSEGSTRLSGERTGSRIRSCIVVGEVAVTIALLTGATLMLRSFVNLTNVDLGFDPKNVLTIQLRPSGERYATAEGRRAFFDELIDRVEARPGVVAASAVLMRPLEGTVGWDWSIVVEGQSPEQAQRNAVPNFEVVTPRYFQTFAVPILAGRTFADRDNDGAPLVVVISKTMAQALFPGIDPLGKRLKLNSSTAAGAWRTVVGVVGDVRYRDLRSVRWDLYLPHAQSTVKTNHFAVRTTSDPLAFAPILRRELAAIDGKLAISGMFTMQKLVDRQLARARFNSFLLNGLAVLALLLAAVGIYGVMSYSVAQRTDELGVRMALGAQARDVFSLVIRRGMTLVGLGLAIGLIAATAFASTAKTLLFGISASDPISYAVTSLLLVATALLACWVPARRATRVDPIRALRAG
jgi:putative ABC transport system permease protein